MNIFLTIFAIIMQNAVPVVLGIQQMHSNAANETKAQLAKDALTIAVTTANNIPMSSKNAQIANVVGVLASGIIDGAVTLTKANGTYQAATSASLNLPVNTTVADIAHN